MPKISALPQDTSPALTDIMPMVDETAIQTKKIALSDLITFLTAQMLPSGFMTEYGGRTAPSGFLLCYGQAVSRTTYASLFSALVPSLGTVTATIASPGVFTLNNHGLNVGDAVYLTTTGALPTGLAINTVYYVISAGLATNTFELATARGGSAINTTGSQSGTHTLYFCPYGLGDGTTTFNVPDMRGRDPSGADAMGGTAANRISNSGGGSGIYGAAMGSNGGEETHTLALSEIASHLHTSSGGNTQVTGSAGGSIAYQSGGNANSQQAMSSQGGGGAHNNMEPSIIVNYIIKT